MSALSELSFAFKRFWKSVVLATVVGSLVGFVVSAILPVDRNDSFIAISRIYVLTPEAAKALEQRIASSSLHSASGKILIQIESPGNSTQTSDAYTKSRIPTYAAILDSDSTRAAVAAVVNRDVSEIEERVSVTPRGDANLIEIQALAEDPATAQEIVQGYVSELANRLGQGENEAFSVELLEVEAESPAAAVGELGSSGELTAIPESLLRQESDLLVTERFDSLLAEELQSKVLSDPTFSQLKGTSDSVLLSIEPGSVTATPETAEVAPQPASTGGETWVVSVSSDDGTQASALLELAADSVGRELAEIYELADVSFSPVVIGASNVVEESDPFLEGRGPADAQVTNVVLGALIGTVLGILYALARVNIAPVIRSPHQVVRLTGKAPYRIQRLNLRGKSSDQKAERADYLPVAMWVASELPEGGRILLCPASSDGEAIDVALHLAEALNEIRGSVCVLDFSQRGSREPCAFVPTRPESSALPFVRDPKLERELASYAPDVSGSSHLDHCAGQFSYTIVVADALDASMDGLLVSQSSNGVLMTMRYGSTRLRDVAAALALIEQARVRLFGTLVIDVPESEGREWLAHSVGELSSQE